MPKRAKKFTTKSTLDKILGKPGAAEVLAKHGVPCLSCPMASFELEKLQIGQVCKMYNLPLSRILKSLAKLK